MCGGCLLCKAAIVKVTKVIYYMCTVSEEMLPKVSKVIGLQEAALRLIHEEHRESIMSSCSPQKV